MNRPFNGGLPLLVTHGPFHDFAFPISTKRLYPKVNVDPFSLFRWLVQTWCWQVIFDSNLVFECFYQCMFLSMYSYYDWDSMRKSPDPTEAVLGHYGSGGPACINISIYIYVYIYIWYMVVVRS